MKISVLIICFLWVSVTYAQKETFQGQAPIRIVPTKSLPIQKQWKGNYTFENSDVVFSNNFDGARLNGILKENDSTYTALITSENTPINISPWYAFKVWAKKPQTIHVMLTYQDPIKHRYYPKLSKDGLHWTALDSINYTAFEKGDAAFGAGSLARKASMRLQVGPDVLWVAGQELQTSKHVKRWADSLSVNKHISQHVIGKSREGRDMNVLTIGKLKRKHMIMVISRQHPPEVTGYLAMKAFIETIASNNKLAKKFRKKYTVHVVPLMNPDGVDNGHWRHNLGGIDLNRDWSHFNQPETQAVKAFMEERVLNTKGKFYFGIDFHSTWDDIYYTVDPILKGNMPGLVVNWLDRLKEDLPGYDPNIRPSADLMPTAVSRNYFFVEHGAESLVFEIGDNTPRNFIKKKGRTSANILMELMLKRKK